MGTIKRIYNRTDEWLMDRSQGQYAVFLGMSGGVGVLVVGLLLGGEFVLVRALTMALVMFGLEFAFGLHQTTEEG